MMEITGLQELSGDGGQLEAALAALQSRRETRCGRVDRSDCELEQWFARHRSELVNLRSYDVVRIAAWLPIIGLPANDNVYPRYRWVQHFD